MAARSNRLVTLLAGTMLASVSTAAMAVPYTLATTIAVPASSANNQGGALTGFDISYVDPVTGYYYFADRSNASVDIFNGASNTYVGRVTGFTGQLSSTSISGPDGVVVVTSNGVSTLYAGDGGSTLRSFNVTNPAAPVATGSVNTGGGSNRVDELAYSPSTGHILAANNANTPAFANIIATSPNISQTASGNRFGITVSAQTNPAGGMEQPVWDSATNSFFVSVPQFGTTDAGGVQEFDANGNLLRTYNFSSMGISACGPAGLALGSNGNLVVGCASAQTQTVVLNPAGSGSIVATIGAVSGSDELWYDPTSNDYFVTGVNSASQRVIDVINGSTYALLQEINLAALGVANGLNVHSVAVDPFNGEIFVPLEGTTGANVDTLCPNGCVAVFATAQAVPEPASYALIGSAVIGMLGIGGALRRTRSAA